MAEHMTAVTAEQYGPSERILRTCNECKACVSESYRCQSDSGHDVYCAHPSLPERKRIGDTTWSTPDWCPALASRLSGMAAVPEGQIVVPRKLPAYVAVMVSVSWPMSHEHVQALWAQTVHTIESLPTTEPPHV